MKTIGLIGGMSWESTVTYYQIINQTIKRTLGGLHSAKCLLYSVDFFEIEECQSKGDWAKSAEILSDAAQRLEKAGADFIVICTNTMHKVANTIQSAVSIPILHIAEVTARQLKANDISKVALLGTKYTMEQDFYRSKLTQNGITVVVPDENDRELINSVIYNELCLGVIQEASRQKFLSIMNGLADQGAQGAILGCTEIGLLVGQKDTDVPLFDTTLIHAESAALYSIA
ncbi:aspartate/glutamate racemase family protein [Marasmitruncus massiliensis]|uniref:aspartate/glutamate racemase family protein n=1 Tax=Marasmitruncus massiliensis TaxID=1944642 RepID=UPI000C7DAE16|nr:aspartate/glutamate racemase family protein [Marasmitruncus massiliensis]